MGGNSNGKKLILYGAGVIGKLWVKHLGRDKVYCFADLNRSGEMINGKRVLSPEDLKMIKGDVKIYISASYENKKEIIKKLKELGMEDNIVGSPYLDKDLFFDKNAFIDVNSKFGGRNALLKGVQFYDSEIGYASYISSNTILSNVSIGKYSSIGPNVRIIQGQHPTKKFVSTHPIFYSTQQIIRMSYVTNNLFEEYRMTENGYTVEIGNDVWIGNGVTIMEGVKIADGTIIAARANVVKDTEPYSIVGGNPARLIRFRFEKEQREFLKELRWWNKGMSWIEEHAEFFDDINKLQEKLRDE